MFLLKKNKYEIKNTFIWLFKKIYLKTNVFLLYHLKMKIYYGLKLFHKNLSR